MQSFFCFVLTLVHSIHFVISENDSSCPYSFPYCSKKSVCSLECIREEFPNCFLLPMDETTRDRFLLYHNQIRNAQSATDLPPSGMPILQYHMQLEEISRYWAKKCKNEYSECFMTPDFPETSQSVMQVILSRGESPDLFLWARGINNLLNKGCHLSIETVSLIPYNEYGQKLHNIAQILGDRTIFVGCAWSISDDVLTFVCTYGPRGPQQGEPIYQLGDVCTLCPEWYKCDYLEPFKSLCKPESPTLPGERDQMTPPQPAPPVLDSITPSTEQNNLKRGNDSGKELKSSTFMPKKTLSLKKGEDDEQETKSNTNGMMIGVIVSLLLLTAACVFATIIIYTHGFQCR